MKISPLYKPFILFAFLAAVALIGYINSIRVDKENYSKKIYAVVSKVKIDPALRVTLYDKQRNKIKLEAYFLYKSLDFQVNDSLAKDRNSSTLKIFRKDNVGQYKILKKIEP